MHLVKMITDDDGSPYSEYPWHLVVSYGDARRTCCSGEAFGIGESSAEFKEKTSGKITCERCIKIVKWYKSIKL
jgi:hypothetical protein